MIRWIRIAPIGHLVVDEQTACGLDLPGEPEEAHDAPLLSERPFGADTCPFCHRQAKRWFSGAQPMPESLVVAAAAVPPGARRLTAEERTAALQGEPVSAGGDGALAPPTPLSVRGGTVLEPGDDIEFPPDDLPAAVVGGALLVRPTARSRRVKPVDDIDN